MSLLRITVLLMLCIQIVSCRKDNDALLPDLGYSYFPLTEGQVRIYQIDSIGWLGYTFDEPSMTVDIDTVNYQLKEVVEGFFTDSQGRQSARIVRYKRNSDADSWMIHKVYSATITATKAERYEDNVQFVKLIFPPAENEKWTGQYVNSFFPNDTAFTEWEYEYNSVHEPLILNQFVFDSTLTVIQKNDINLIEYRYFLEQYAAGTGMIYKEYSYFDYPSTSSSFIKNGFIYKETLIATE